jgi:hypothetical protein
MQQLSLLKPEIVEKLNRNLGRNAISDITLRLGEVAAAEKPLDDIPVHTSLDQEDREKIERYVQDVHDPETRAAIKHLIEKDLLSKKRMT